MNDRESSVGARLFVGFQRVLPQHLLSLLMYRFARIEWVPLKNLMIRAYVRLVGVDLSAAAQPEPTAYPHLNAFFTRALRPDARPLDPDPRAVLSPVDGTISQFGTITDGRIIQAKGLDYSVRDLLGGRGEAHHLFDGGRFRSQLQEQGALYDGAVEQYNDSIVQAVAQVADAVLRIDSVRRQDALAQHAVQAARRQQQLAEQAYRAGLTDALNAINAQLTVLNEEQQQALVASKQLENYTLLMTALGGGIKLKLP